MQSFWTTETAKQRFPFATAAMNEAEKLVFSKTLDWVDWNNTRLIKDNIVEEVRQLKHSPGKDMTILGSGSIITLFAAHGLIDEYDFMLDPLAFGAGSQSFKGLSHQLNLKLVYNRTFKSGTLLLRYQPLK